MSASKPSDIKKVLLARSERVKCVDMHPKEPLVLCSLYSGQVTLWNYDTQVMVKSFEILDQTPVRAVKFLTKMQCFVCAADDMALRVFNYNTMEKVKTIPEAHQDYIRAIAVHDHLPYFFTSSDDMTIRMWQTNKDFACKMVYEGHSHYVMAITMNPKDQSTFASASLDETVKVWSITTPTPNFTLEGHEEGVNCVEYYQGGDKPYIISGSDDRTVRIWDYQTKACVQVLSHHVHNIPCVMFHPDLPLLISGSEDETVGIFSTQTWRQEATLNYGLHRAWTISSKPGMGKVAIGFDGGLVVIRLGKEEPVMSMDSNGKILIATNQEITRMDIKNLADKDVQDSEPIMLTTKEVGTTESIPQKLLHGPSGQYIAVLFEGEYTVNSSLAWRPKTFGQAIAFVWGSENGSYAILESGTTLKTFKQFKAKETHTLPSFADALFAGPLLGVRSTDGAISFYDWETFNCIRRIEISPKDVVWSDSGELVALITDTATYLLKYNSEDVAAHFEEGKGTTADGLEFAFDVVEEMEERVKQAQWIGDCLCYVNQHDRLNYYIGGEVTTISVLPRPMFMLGFLAKENRVFLIDKEKNVISFQLYVSVIDYKTAIVREDFDTAAEVLPSIPKNMLYKTAQFLQARKLIELALEVTPEEDHRFDLAIQLNKLNVAAEIVKKSPSAARWKQVGDLALKQAHWQIAEMALFNANDLNSMLLLYTSMGAKKKIADLAELALAKGRSNVAFTCYHVTGNHDACIELLLSTNRVPEAAFYARTYCHHRVNEIVGKWKLKVANLPNVRDSIADPESYPNLFPNMKDTAPPPAAAAEPEAEAEAEVESETPVSPPKAASGSPRPSIDTTPKHQDPAADLDAASPTELPNPTSTPATTPGPASNMMASPPMSFGTPQMSTEGSPMHPPAPASTPAATIATPQMVTPPPSGDTPAPSAAKPEAPSHDELFGDDDDDDGFPAGDTAAETAPAPAAAASKDALDDDLDELWGEDA